MRRAVALLTALLLALAACGGEEHPEAHEGDSDAAQSTTSARGTDSTEPGGGGPTATGNGEHAHGGANFPAAEATDIVKMSMRDFAFVDMPATVTGPKLRIEAKNNGPSAHEALLFDADGNEVAGIDPVVTGKTADLSVELTAGTYELRCQIAISANETHADRGMRVTFAVM